MLGKFLILCGFMLTLWTGQAAAQELAEFKAVLQRGDNSRIRISFTVQSLDAPDYITYELAAFNSIDGVNMLTKFLDICIFDAAATDKKCTESQQKLPFTNNNGLDTTPQTTQQISQIYDASFIDGSTQFNPQGDDPNVRKLTTVIELHAGTEANKFSTSTQVTVRLLPGKAVSSSNFKELEGQKVTAAIAVNDVPKNIFIRSSKGTLTAIWDQEATVTLGNGTKGKPDGVLGFVVPADDWDVHTIPLHSYNQDNPQLETTIAKSCAIKETTPTTCSVQCNDANSDAITTNTHYFKSSEVKGAGYETLESGSNTSLQISGLTQGTRYAFVLQYQPDGLQRTCLISTPSDAVTLSELGGGPEPTLKDPRCFIATAAYGSALDPHLNTLRWFRDHVLLLTNPGRSFVKTYYRLSPPVADFIAESPTLRAMTRSLLWLPVVLIETWRERPSLLLTLSAMAGTFLLLFMRRRSLRALV